MCSVVVFDDETIRTPLRLAQKLRVPLGKLIRDDAIARTIEATADTCCLCVVDDMRQELDLAGYWSWRDLPTGDIFAMKR